MSTPHLSRRGFLSGALLASAVGFFLQGMPPRANAIKFPEGPVPQTLPELEAYLAQTRAPIYLLETEIPDTFSSNGGTMEISDARGKTGSHSLLWDFNAGATLEIDTPLEVNASKYNPNLLALSYAVPHFAFWVYNETPVDDVMRVEFCTDDRVDCAFDFHLNFSGWRTCWVRYGYDTEGAPTNEMNRVVMHAPATAGRLWIDQVILNSEMRADHATPDHQAQKIHPYIAMHHWMGLVDFESYLTNPGLDYSPATTEEIEAVQTIRERLLSDNRANVDFSSAGLDAVEAELTKYSIPQLAERMSASDPVRPATSGPFSNHNQVDIFPSKVRNQLKNAIGSVQVRSVMDVALVCAQTWDAANRAGDTAATQRAAEQYLRVMAYLFDQGWAAGSSQGSTHHIGYAYRGWAISILLGEEILRANGMWEDAFNALTWYAGTGRLTQKLNDEESLSGLVDVMNTLLHGLLISCTLADTTEDRVARLRAFRDWINQATEYSPGNLGGFKPDGTMYHHMGMYMAYGRDALNGGVPVIARVNATPFGLQGDRANTLRQALLVQRRLSNTYEYPLTFSGRHPTGVEGMHSGLTTMVDLYGMVGLRPFDKDQEFDVEMAAAFRSLMPPEPTEWQKETDAIFAKAGIKPEVPTGYWSYGYGAAAQARQDNWSVTVRGHNRYAWTAETYRNSNLYGRYLTYGQIELQALQDSTGIVTHEANGFVQPGLDWRRLPGTTTIQIPVEDMMADMTGRTSIMLMTRPAFGGGGAMADHAALFGMDLEEHPMYNASHRARISAFLVGNRVFALGSNISNDDGTNPTYTTMFQMTPDTMSTPGELIKKDNWFVDPAGNGFVVFEGNAQSSVESQTNPDQSGKSEGTHTFATGWIDHGTAPENSGYAYALLVQAGEGATAEFASAQPVSIIQRDAVAHIVHDDETGIEAFTIFEADTELTADATVRSASRPSLILSRPIDGTQVAWSVTDPDLHLFEGEDPDQWDGNTYVGSEGPYHRPWRGNASPTTSTTVVLAGEWELLADEDGNLPSGVEISSSADSSTLTITASDATSVEFVLARVGSEPTDPDSQDPSEEPSGSATPTAPSTPGATPSTGPSAPGGSGGTLPTTGVAVGATAIGAGVAGAGAWAAYRLRQKLADSDDVLEEMPQDEA